MEILRQEAITTQRTIGLKVATGYFYIYILAISSQSEENNENQLKMACLAPNEMLNSCQIKPKYVKVNDILTDRFDSSDESKSRFIL